MVGSKTDETGEMTRREFVGAAGLFVCGLALGSTALLTGCGSPPAPAIGGDAFEVEEDRITVTLAKAPGLTTVGGSISITNESPQVSLVVARTTEDSFAVVSNRCTHNGKAIGYDHSTGLFSCVSGKSKFRLDGTVVKGPAKGPLATYSWQAEAGRLIIDLSK